MIHPTALRKVVWQTAAMIGIAAAVALLVNALRPDGIALIEDWSPAARLQATPDSGDRVISINQAAAFHGSGDALFVDVRAPEAFAAGRIAGAINIPRDAVFDYLERIFRAAPDFQAIIIVYCDDDASCTAAEELVLLLRDMGYVNTRVLVNGWTLWQTHGYPVATD